MRVVDDERERLALVDGLEAAGHGIDPGQRRDDRLVRDAERARGGHGAEHVVDVEAPRQRRAQLEAARAERRAGEVAGDRRRPQVGVGRVDRDRDDRRAVELACEAGAVGVVDVDDRHRRAGFEQAPLRRVVVVHRRVEVEVVLREVREDRGSPVDRVGAAECERVA